MIKRILICSCCGCEVNEDSGGFRDCCGIVGVELNGTKNPDFCPSCTNEIMTFVDILAETSKNDVDNT